MKDQIDGETVRARVRLTLARRRLSQASLARRMGVSRQRLSTVLRYGVPIPMTPAFARRISEALEICTGELTRPLTQDEWAELGRAS